MTITIDHIFSILSVVAVPLVGYLLKVVIVDRVGALTAKVDSLTDTLHEMGERIGHIEGKLGI